MSEDLWQTAAVTIGERLRRHREAQNLTQTELANLARVNKETVNRFELGGKLTMRKIEAIIGALGFTAFEEFLQAPTPTMSYAVVSALNNPAPAEDHGAPEMSAKPTRQGSGPKVAPAWHTPQTKAGGSHHAGDAAATRSPEHTRATYARIIETKAYLLDVAQHLTSLSIDLRRRARAFDVDRATAGLGVHAPESRRRDQRRRAHAPRKRGA